MQPSIEDLFARWREHREPRDLAAVFDRCAGELWQLGHHLCGDRTEADDLLQATFLAAMQSAAHWRREQPLRPWLSGILANKLRMQRRRRRNALPAATERATDPAVEAQHRELRAVLQQRIARLAEPYRAVLVLQLDHGLSPAEIAHALGRERATVRSQLQRGLELLRRGLPISLLGSAARGMALPQLGAVRAAIIAAAGSAAATTGTLLTTGVMLMAKKLLIAGLLFLIAGAAAWWVWPPVSATSAAPASSALPRTDAARSAAVPTAAAANDRSAPVATDAAEPDSAAGIGGLRVRVAWPDGTAAAGIGVAVEPPAERGGFLAQRWRDTDTAGIAEYGALPPGRFIVTARNDVDAGIEVDVRADSLTECELRLPPGVDLRGIVVDLDGNAVPNATIALGPRTGATSDRMLPITVADRNGAFFLRAVPAPAFVAAFAELHESGAPETVADLAARDTVQLRVGRAAEPLDGRVVDEQGVGIAGAWVAEGWLAFQPGQRAIQIVRTDAAGYFRLLGVSTTMRQLHAAAANYATWNSYRYDRLTSPLEIRLEAGATIQGIARGADGDVVPHPRIQRIIDTAAPGKGIADQRPRWCAPRVAADANGNFRIDHIAPGRVEVAMRDRQNTRAAYREFTVQPGQEIHWDPELVERPTIRGRIVDPSGNALVDWRVIADGPSCEPAPRSELSDDNGEFTVPECLPTTYTLLVYAAGEEWNPPVHAVEGVVAGGDPMIVHVPAVAVPDCVVRGTVPPTSAAGPMTLRLDDVFGGSSITKVVQAGQPFELGPVPARTYAIVAEMKSPAGPLLTALLATHALQPGQVVDLGPVTLPEPGQIVVELVDPAGRPVPKTDLALTLWGTSSGGSLLHIVDGRAEANALPGTYAIGRYLRRECIEQPPVVVRSGERTTVALQCRAAVERDFVFEVPAAAMPRGARMTLRKHATDVFDSVFHFGETSPTHWRRSFSPGDWELQFAFADGGIERFPFVVTTDTAAPPIVIRVTR